MQQDFIRLKPIMEETSYYDKIEENIKSLFKKEFYFPVLQILNLKQNILQNAVPTALEDAIRFDKIFYSNGSFSGNFTAEISKELRSYGATWDNQSSSYKIDLDNLPWEIKNVISTSKARFNEKLGAIDKTLSTMDPEEISKKVNIAQYFDSTLWKVEREFHKSIKNITVVPKLTKLERKKIADDWQTNMELDIKKLVESQIIELRQNVYDNVFAKGNRREALIKGLQASYDVTENKAKFWARQETNLLMAKYKETKYVEAGVPEYEWRCVHMPHQPSPKVPYKAGEVRYSHGILEGKIFRWENPPITTAPGQPVRRCNPGQDFNCRCFAIPIVRFKK